MKNLVPVLFFALPAFLFSQTSVQQVFQLSPGYDAGQVLLPTSGGYAIFGRQTPGPGARSDVFFLRVDADGNQILYKKYGDANASEAVGKGVVTLSNGWLVAGSKEIISSIGWLLRLSSAGDVLWTKELPNVGQINQMVPLPSGGLLATGQVSGKMFLMKLTEDGTVVWQQNFSAGEGRDLYVTMGGNACVVLGRNKVWKVHLVSKQVQWEQTVTPPSFGPTGQTELLTLNALVPAGAGRFAILGSAYTELPTELYSGHFAAVWSETGVPIWQKFLRDRTTGYDQNEGTSIFYLPNSTSLLFAGTDQGKLVVTRTDMKGKILEEDVINAPGEMYSVVLLKDAGRYVMTGAILTGGIGTYFYRSADNAVDKIKPAEVGSAPKAHAEGIRLLQSPGSSRALVELYAATDQERNLQLRDAQGRLVWEKHVQVAAGLNHIAIDTGVFAEGLYWLFDANNRIQPKALFIRK